MNDVVDIPTPEGDNGTDEDRSYSFKITGILFPRVQVIEERIEMTLEGFVGNIGGVMGFYIGASVISIFQILFFLLYRCSHQWHKKRFQKLKIAQKNDQQQEESRDSAF